MTIIHSEQLVLRQKLLDLMQEVLSEKADLPLWLQADSQLWRGHSTLSGLVRFPGLGAAARMEQPLDLAVEKLAEAERSLSVVPQHCVCAGRPALGKTIREGNR